MPPPQTLTTAPTNDARSATAITQITTFTDPNCPWAFTAEASRLALRWTYGDQLTWRRAYVVISEHVGQSEAGGFTPEVEAREDVDIAARFGMPLSLQPRPRITTSLKPALAAIAARGLGPDAEERLLRALFRRGRSAGELIDEPGPLRAAITDADLDPDTVIERMSRDDVQAELRAEMSAARHPAPAAQQLRHKLGAGASRYTSPSWLISRPGQPDLVAPGFQLLAVYETLLANAAPQLQRRDLPGGVGEALDWAARPLATAEVAAVCARPIAEVRAELEQTARFQPAGSDGFWTTKRSS